MKISECCDAVSVPHPIFLSPNDTVLQAGALLSWENITTVVVMGDDKILGAIYGYQILAILLGKEKPVYKTLFQGIRNVTKILPLESIPTVGIGGQVGDALGEIAEKKFGDVLVLGKGKQQVGVLSLRDMLQACERRFSKLDVHVGEVASDIKAVSGDMSFSDLMLFLFRNRCRRMLVRKADGYHCADDRDIIRHLFSLGTLQLLRDDARAVLNSPIRDFIEKSATPIPDVKSGDDIATAWKEAISAGQFCVTVDGKKIATPWDLVVKPYLQGKLRL